jgi:signal transduction histidine kinase
VLRSRLTSIRGQLILCYLGALAILLATLGVFQIVTLRNYLQSSTALSLRRSAYSELGVLGPCYVHSKSDLSRNADTLSRLLGGHDIAVTIVTPSGQTLASHGMGPSGATRPLRLSASSIRRLIGHVPAQASGASQIRLASCPRPSQLSGNRTLFSGSHPPSPWASSLLGGGDILLVAVPLGPLSHPVGFAILGRSFSSANDTITRVLLFFVLGALAALLVAALIALPLINRALRPLRRVAETAESIAAGELAQRANLARSSDEIGRLGLAFDTMVDRLQHALSSAEASEERMRNFLADASHELRTPATVLQGASQVLLRLGAESDPEMVEGLRDMHEEAVRLARLIDDLLTLTRLDGGQPLAPSDLHLRSFLRDFRDRYASLWPDRDVRIEDSELDGVEVRMDPDALRRVLTNLVENAARYSRKGTPISLEGNVSGPSVAVAVKDEGPGMTPEDADHAFDRFFRTSRSRSRASGGNGLGLPIVRGLVEVSGGSIEIDTGAERGTTVRFTVPRVSASRPDAKESEPA